MIRVNKGVRGSVIRGGVEINDGPPSLIPLAPKIAFGPLTIESDKIPRGFQSYRGEILAFSPVKYKTVQLTQTLSSVDSDIRETNIRGTIKKWT